MNVSSVCTTAEGEEEGAGTRSLVALGGVVVVVCMCGYSRELFIASTSSLRGHSNDYREHNSVL